MLAYRVNPILSNIFLVTFYYLLFILFLITLLKWIFEMNNKNLIRSINIAILSLATQPSYASNTDLNQFINRNLANLHECEPKDDQEPLCDISTTEQPAFDTQPITYFSDQIDLRPENCESFYDDYLHFRRGMRVESALGTVSNFNSYQETVSTFPVIDFISGSRGHVVKSKDLTSTTYNKPTLNGPLYDSIIADALDIQTRVFDSIKEKGYLAASAKGSTTIIRHGELKQVSMHIIIQAGMATDRQVSEIIKAREEVKRVWGFDLEIIEIP